MRDLINLIEGRIEKVDAGSKEIFVCQNPTLNQFLNAFKETDELRGILDEYNNLYIWQARLAVHEKITRLMGIENPLFNLLFMNDGGYIYITPSDKRLDYNFFKEKKKEFLQKLIEIPSIKRILPSNNLDDLDIDGPFSDIVNEEIEPMRKVWHITPSVNVAKIMKQGLLPQIGKRSKSAKEKHKSLFVFPDSISMEDALTNWLGDELEDIPLSILELTIPSNWLIQHPIRYEEQINHIVPPSMIKILITDIDDWDGKYPGNPPSGWFPNEYLNERTETVYSSWNDKVTVYIDPSHEQFKKLIEKHGELRGVIDDFQNLYVWDSRVAIHDDVIVKLGIHDVYSFYMSRKEVRISFRVNQNPVKKEFKNIPAIKNAYGDWDFYLYNDRLRLVESKETITVKSQGHEYPVDVWTNPSKLQFYDLLHYTKYHELRGIMDLKGNLYVWRSDEAIHQHVENALGFQIKDLAGELVLLHNYVSVRFAELSKEEFKKHLSKIYNNIDDVDFHFYSVLKL
jgi:hypothetical protein